MLAQKTTIVLIHAFKFNNWKKSIFLGKHFPALRVSIFFEFCFDYGIFVGITGIICSVLCFGFDYTTVN